MYLQLSPLPKFALSKLVVHKTIRCESAKRCKNRKFSETLTNLDINPGIMSKIMCKIFLNRLGLHKRETRPKWPKDKTKGILCKSLSDQLVTLKSGLVNLIV